MEAISNVDRIVLLLRQRLEERAKSAKPSATGQTSSSHLANRGGLTPVQALAAAEGVDEHQVRRAVIQNLLAHQLGRKLINDARFQQVVDRVTETLERDPASAKLLAQVISELRASSGAA